MIIDGHEYLPAPPDLARAWVLYQATFRAWEEAATGRMRPVPPYRTYPEWMALPLDRKDILRSGIEMILGTEPLGALIPLMGRLRRDEQTLAETLCMDAPHVESQFFRPFSGTEGYRIPGAIWHHAGIPINLPPRRTRWDWRLNEFLPADVRPRTFGDCFR